MIIEVIVITISLLLSILIHEAGHVIVYHSFTKKYPKLNINRKEISLTYPAKDVTPQQQIIIILAGIVAGVLPLVLLADILNLHNGYLIALLLVYKVGCIWDFEELIKEIKTVIKGG
jgi:uncharacterized membrane protein YbjE (DUF340 family)|tara:strand:- start:829 stop:1179 length:351 start_codon:yes stop_codon:yes gene_type:complete